MEVADSAQDALRGLIDTALRTCLKGEFQKAIDFIKAKDELSSHPLAQFVFTSLFSFFFFVVVVVVVLWF